MNRKYFFEKEKTSGSLHPIQEIFSIEKKRVTQLLDNQPIVHRF